MSNITSTTGPFGEIMASASQKSSVAILAVLISTLGVLVKTVWQPAFPRGSPKVFKGWPIVGAVELFKKRWEFLHKCIKQSPTGNFSTYIGKYQVLMLSGVESRKFFYESKELDLSAGNALFLSRSPMAIDMHHIPVSKDDADGNIASSFPQWFNQTMIKMLRRETFSRSLPYLVSDASDAMKSATDSNSNRTSGTLDAFDHVRRIVYQLTMRQLGPKEVAEDSKLREKILRLFEEVERGGVPSRMMFPWLPTIPALRQMIGGARLYVIFSSIAKRRKAEKRREDDAFQFLLDQGISVMAVVVFVIGSLFAGQLNSGVNAGWLLAALATSPEWYQRVRSEVDASVNKHRKSPLQTATEVLKDLEVEQWETEFPSIDLALRESIRFNLVGTPFRGNTSGKDLPIGNSGEIVPQGAYVMYHYDDLHMDPAVYTDPEKFDPGRYLPDREEDRKVPYGYLGWGAGRHPCIGTRFAKLEMNILVATLSAMFDWEYVDAKGTVLTQPPPIDRNKDQPSRPSFPVLLRYTLRQH